LQNLDVQLLEFFVVRTEPADLVLSPAGECERQKCDDCLFAFEAAQGSRLVLMRGKRKIRCLRTWLKRRHAKSPLRGPGDAPAESIRHSRRFGAKILRRSNIHNCHKVKGDSMAQDNAIGVMASAAFKEAFLVLIPEFERASAQRTHCHWISTGEMMTRVKAGEMVDLVFLTAGMIDELIAHGRLENRADLVRSSVGVAVRAGAPRPNLANGEALKQALLSARSIAYSLGPSGVYIADLVKRLGIEDALRAKTRIVRGEPVGDVVARGEAEIGFQQISELLPVAGIDLIGPLPADVGKTQVFSVGLHVASACRDAAQSLVDFLRTPRARAVFAEKGLAPI
jgi:molybdate transport system substrate-binding protein